ncbi:site-specific DNA-methyltransferase [Nocardioides marmoriginsengisoli]|uniref:Methyltransferase n=1 Tax=Nocardioides marmoriginsengisoli TaxID=661483 RepID=A0A3N0CTI9_9ACTN|nr:site-specific DNA-methyltransferase [Nocardioides marmoriginsengisoli]RNL66273.1 site-specific DNA-methyltransferase [Nocardioides marmoriginsengisoli]
MKPYYEDDSVQLFHGDCRDLLPQLDVTADLLIADPPYGETNLDWDTWPNGWPAFAAQYGKSMWCFGSMRMFLTQRHEFNDWHLSQDIVWEKHNGSSLASDRFSRVHEHALFWYRGPWVEIYHQTPTTPDATARAVRRKAKPAYHQGARGASSYVSEDGGPRLMRSVIYCRSMHGRAINETEKPTGLLEPLIEYGCPGGGLLVDLFSGSGAALMAAKMTGRKAIGFEIRESQCEGAARRLAQDSLFGGAA